MISTSFRYDEPLGYDFDVSVDVDVTIDGEVEINHIEVDDLRSGGSPDLDWLVAMLESDDAFCCHALEQAIQASIDRRAYMAELYSGR